MAIEYRWADDQFDRLPALAADLVRRQVAVIVTRSEAPLRRWPPRLRPRRSPSSSHVAEDPVRLGLVASLARPGGNLTGINFFNASWRQSGWSCCASWCRQRRGWRPRQPGQCPDYETTLQRRGSRLRRAMGLQIQVFQRQHRAARSMPPSQALARERPDALFVGPDTIFTGRRVQLVALGGAPRDPRDVCA